MRFSRKIHRYGTKLLNLLFYARGLQDYITILRKIRNFSLFRIKRSFNKMLYGQTFFRKEITKYKLTAEPDFLVSVIVPNFNHDKFLQERLDSIYAQDYNNFEVILLDDDSSDQSRRILNTYLTLYPDKTRLYVNEKNSGSGYKQWMKGIELARGQIIWIAESDDVSESKFLSSLVPKFANPAVKLAFSNTIFFEKNPQDEIWDLTSYWSGRTSLNPSQGWTILDVDFLNSGMKHSNLIPNVSSSLFKKPSDFQLKGSWTNYKYCGDWLFYVYQISGGLVAFEPNVTNYYRIHNESTIKKNAKSQEFSKELNSVINEIDSLMSRPRVLFSLPGLVIGGGEVFPFRMAQVCEKYGVVASLVDYEMIPSLDKDFFTNDNSVPIFRPYLVPQFLGQLGNKWDLIYSHHASADSVSAKYKPTSHPHLISLHGMYEEMKVEDVLDLEAILSSNPAQFTYTTEKNLTAFSAEFISSNNFQKVSNFVPDHLIPTQKLLVRSMSVDVNICLIARAIEGKGWLEAIEATIVARDKTNRNINLYLYGNGPINSLVRDQYNFSWLHVFDSTENSILTASSMDAGLFLSTYVGESMPLILMEFLAIGLPTIFTSNGLSTEMMTDSHGAIGFPIIETSRRARIQEIASALEELCCKEPIEIENIKIRMLEKYKFYSEHKIMIQYLELFYKLIGSSPKKS